MLPLEGLSNESHLWDESEICNAASYLSNAMPMSHCSNKHSPNFTKGGMLSMPRWLLIVRDWESAVSRTMAAWDV